MMSEIPSVESAVGLRRERLFRRHAQPFASELLRDGLYTHMVEDDQLTRLLAMAVHARRLTGRRGATRDADDTVAAPLLAVIDRVDEAIHRRAIEVVALTCRAYLTGNAEWFDLPADDEVDATVMQDGLDAKEEAERWLKTHGVELSHLGVPGPGDLEGDRMTTEANDDTHC